MLLDYVPLRPNIKVLDMGCGTAFPLLELAQRLGPSCAVIGLDTWEAALERARFKARVSGVRKEIVNPRHQEDIFSRLEANLNQWAESRGELVMTIPMAYVEAEKPE